MRILTNPEYKEMNSQIDMVGLIQACNELSNIKIKVKRVDTRHDSRDIYFCTVFYPIMDEFGNEFKASFNITLRDYYRDEYCFDVIQHRAEHFCSYNVKAYSVEDLFKIVKKAIDYTVEYVFRDRNVIAYSFNDNPFFITVGSNILLRVIEGWHKGYVLKVMPTKTYKKENTKRYSHVF
jgi:hypothetical protein